MVPWTCWPFLLAACKKVEWSSSEAFCFQQLWHTLYSRRGKSDFMLRHKLWIFQILGREIHTLPPLEGPGIIFYNQPRIIISPSAPFQYDNGWTNNNPHQVLKPVMLSDLQGEF